MKTSDVLYVAGKHLDGLRGHSFDVIELAKPVSPEAAVNLTKIVSKLSPLVGNLLEFNTCEYLNELPDFNGLGRWHRQDPGFPDTVFRGDVTPTPGFEIKAWFPLATEITARFKDSQKSFGQGNTFVALLAWLPESLIFGKPSIIDIVIVSGASVAKARDDHYHNPPGYIVIEPNDTAARTANLQQTNTAGYIFQGTEDEFEAAKAFVESWGAAGRIYSPDHSYQLLLAQLMANFSYRLDTNFAKIDRIRHVEIEKFKTRVHRSIVHGRSVHNWKQIFSLHGRDSVAKILSETFGIGEGLVGSVVE